MSQRDTIFKGATRPPMMAGVPIIPFILLVGIGIVAAMWALILFGFFWALCILMFDLVCVFVLRYISSQDDHRLNQHLMRIRDIGFRRNSAYWNAHSMSPIEFNKRRLQ